LKQKLFFLGGFWYPQLHNFEVSDLTSLLFDTDGHSLWVITEKTEFLLQVLPFHRHAGLISPNLRKGLLLCSPGIEWVEGKGREGKNLPDAGLLPEEQYLHKRDINSF